MARTNIDENSNGGNFKVHRWGEPQKSVKKSQTGDLYTSEGNRLAFDKSAQNTLAGDKNQNYKENVASQSSDSFDGNQQDSFFNLQNGMIEDPLRKKFIYTQNIKLKNDFAKIPTEHAANIGTDEYLFQEPSDMHLVDNQRNIKDRYRFGTVSPTKDFFNRHNPKELPQENTDEQKSASETIPFSKVNSNEHYSNRNNDQSLRHYGDLDLPKQKNEVEIENLLNANGEGKNSIRNDETMNYRTYDYNNYPYFNQKEKGGGNKKEVTDTQMNRKLEGNNWNINKFNDKYGSQQMYETDENAYKSSKTNQEIKETYEEGKLGLQKTEQRPFFYDGSDKED